MATTMKTNIPVTIYAEGTMILTTEHLLEELANILDNALMSESYHSLSKKTGVNVRTLHQIKNKNLSNPQVGTVLKILQAMGKKIVIVD